MLTLMNYREVIHDTKYSYFEKRLYYDRTMHNPQATVASLCYKNYRRNYL